MLFLKCPPCNPTLKNTPLKDTDPSETLPASPRTGSPILPQDLAQSPWVSLDCLSISHHESTLKGMGLGDRSPRFQFWLTHLPATWLCHCSVAKSFPTLCDPMDCSTPVFSILHHLLELAQTPVHWTSDAIQPSHPLSPHSPPAFSPSQYQGHFQWVGSSHQMAKVLELQLWYQSFQCVFRVDFLPCLMPQFSL